MSKVWFCAQPKPGAKPHSWTKLTQTSIESSVTRSRRSVATCNVSSIAAKLCCPARCRIPMAISANVTGSANLESAHSGPVVFSTILRKLLLCRGAMPKGQQPPWGKGCNREALRDGFTSGTWARSSLSAALRCRSWRYCARYGAPPGPCRMQSVTLVVKERRRCRCRPPS